MIWLNTVKIVSFQFSVWIKNASLTLTVTDIVITLRYVKFRVENAEAIQSKYATERTPETNETLDFSLVLTLKTFNIVLCVCLFFTSMACLSLSLFQAVTESSEESCHVSCPVDCVVADWSTWSHCSRTCGLGKQNIHVAYCGRGKPSRYVTSHL